MTICLNISCTWSCSPLLPSRLLHTSSTTFENNLPFIFMSSVSLCLCVFFFLSSWSSICVRKDVIFIFIRLISYNMMIYSYIYFPGKILSDSLRLVFYVSITVYSPIYLLYLSIYVFMYLYIYLCIDVSICIYVSICISMYLCIYLSPFIHLCIYWLIYLPIYPIQPVG